jgi:geranylgeranyl diphosphate synthase type I
MDFPKKLGGLKVVIDKELERQFDIAIAEVRKDDILIADALEYAKKIALAGGKRIRGALLYWAYAGLGGKEKKKILKAAAAIELVHLFLLVHDDIIDRGDLRHGKETLHKMFADKKQKVIPAEAARHYGNSMAIIVGDMLYAIANKIILEAGFDDKIAISALVKLQSVVVVTVVGQFQDLEIAYEKKVTEKEVLAMYKNKTARYTIEGPLHIGALLAGCDDKKTLRLLNGYAVPLGIAFQIQDDILGVFSNEKKIGKSVASDIEEGKQSLLVVKALQQASARKQKQIRSILGKKNLTAKEIRIFRDILQEAGALDYAKNLAAQYLGEGKKEIQKAILLPEAKKFLLGLAEYLEKREI